MDGIPKNDWPMEFPFEDGQKCEGIDARRLAEETGGDGQAKQSMSHWPAKGTALGGRMIDMQRIIISRQTREENNIGFRHGPSWALPFVPDHEIIE